MFRAVSQIYTRLLPEAMIAATPPVNSYGLAAADFGGAGIANLAASIVTFGRISLISKFERPSNQVIVHLNGIFSPLTSR